MTEKKPCYGSSEAREQEALFEWAQYYPDLSMLYHIPNGGQRTGRGGAAMKRQGVKKGVPDIHLPVPRGGYHGLWIEMKYGRNRPTKEQQWWLNRLREQGHKVVVCYRFEDAKNYIIAYLKGDIKNEEEERV